MPMPVSDTELILRALDRNYAALLWMEYAQLCELLDGPKVKDLIPTKTRPILSNRRKRLEKELELSSY